jgi:hypothetical protein
MVKTKITKYTSLQFALLNHMGQVFWQKPTFGLHSNMCAKRNSGGRVLKI